MDKIVKKIGNEFVVRINRYGEEVRLRGNAELTVDNIAGARVRFRRVVDGVECRADIPGADGPTRWRFRLGINQARCLASVREEERSDLEHLIYDLRVAENGRL